MNRRRDDSTQHNGRWYHASGTLRCAAPLYFLAATSPLPLPLLILCLHYPSCPPSALGLARCRLYHHASSPALARGFMFPLPRSPRSPGGSGIVTAPLNTSHETYSATTQCDRGLCVVEAAEGSAGGEVPRTERTAEALERHEPVRCANHQLCAILTRSLFVDSPTWVLTRVSMAPSRLARLR